MFKFLKSQDVELRKETDTSGIPTFVGIQHLLNAGSSLRFMFSRVTKCLKTKQIY